MGGGYCDLTFTLFNGVYNATGEVFDSLGGTLAITGGTVYQELNEVDFFTEVAVYVGKASLFVPFFRHCDWKPGEAANKHVTIF